MDRQDRRRGAVDPGRLAAAGPETVDVEAVLHDEQAVDVPGQARRLVVDPRREANGPRTGRRFDPQLGATENVRVVRDPGPEIDQRSPRLRQGEHVRGLATAGPS